MTKTTIGVAAREGPQQFLNAILKASREGGFPANDGPYCCYLTDSGKKCAIGLLFDGEGMRAESGTVIGNDWVQANLPTWLSLEEAVEIQRIHDRLTEKNGYCGWDHAEFVYRVKERPVFAGCNFEENQ